ncbi:hypothetical protein [Aneurinibacillus terranovensis]|nr:hypothetical protein [Aneurinibacillus terranovensis]
MEKKIVGVFYTEDEAIRAIQSLKGQGYKKGRLDTSHSTLGYKNQRLS